MTKFVLVCSDSKIFKSMYRKSKQIESIDHQDIVIKLETNDIYKSNPSKDVVQFFIIQKINKALSSSNIDTIYYRIDKTAINDVSMAENLKLLINTFSNQIKSFDLILLNESVSSLDNKFEKIFDNIYIIESL